MDDLDDHCLSKVISFALNQASLRNVNQVPIGDNGKTERNLSLVSKRWYFITQSLIGKLGVHRVELDKIVRSKDNSGAKLPMAQARQAPWTETRDESSMMNKSFTGSRIARIKATNKPDGSRALATVNTCKLPLKGRQQQQKHQVQSTIMGTKRDSFDISLYRQIRPRLLKYKHILIDGNLTCDEFKKLIVAIDSARIEQLELRINVERDKQIGQRFDFAPKELRHLERLVLFWHNQSSVDYSNGLTWTTFMRASQLKVLEIHLNDGPLVDGQQQQQQVNLRVNDSLIESIASNFIGQTREDKTNKQPHHSLDRIIFKRTSVKPPIDCVYSLLIKNALAREEGVFEFATNDSVLVEHLIRSSERSCTQHELSHLRFLTPIEDIELLGKLFIAGALGRDRLSIEIDTIEQIDEIRHRMEYFKLNRHEESICQLSIYLKDQKAPDLDDKIKSLIQLCRLAKVTVFINAQWRVSIDCCHLMWSIGRALQQASGQGGGGGGGSGGGGGNYEARRCDYGCLFKLNLQVNAFKQSFVEITIPFGSAHQNYCINSNREDMLRHREIMRSLKRDCYHQFVKAVRDNLPACS